MINLNAYQQFNWSNLWITVLILIVLYLLLQFFQQLLTRLNSNNTFLQNFQKGVHFLLVAYEPIALLLIFGVFVLIQPTLHGLLAALFVLFALNPIKNYMTGKIVQLDNSIRVGQRIKIEQVSGVISAVHRLGLQLNTRKGVSFVAYTTLLEQGYLLEVGEKIGGLYQLKITPSEPDEKMDYHLQLFHLLVNMPYVNWSNPPVLSPSQETPHQFHVQLLLREESHLQDLLELMDERQFKCKISKK